MVEVLGYIAAIFTTFSSLPQLIKIIRTKSANDVSVFMFSFLLIGGGLWLIYGILIDSKPLILANIMASILVIFNLYYKYKYNNKSC